ncbi:Tubulin glycylase 3E [Symbiodinium microadriaticum]|uniref:Tubulin glycylase 3E n=1 Tax=Symbiodinium microadriaticum TaxID=2951 RepID=A0A1Q9DQH0_SYMMI|nr:Tubulin glycylase 3E [Symbiodinium microadriaticum]
MSTIATLAQMDYYGLQLVPAVQRMRKSLRGPATYQLLQVNRVPGLSSLEQALHILLLHKQRRHQLYLRAVRSPKGPVTIAGEVRSWISSLLNQSNVITTASHGVGPFVLCPEEDKICHCVTQIIVKKPAGELTTKVCLTRNLRRLAYEEQVDIDTFFPRSYDMGSPSEVEVLRQHLRLAEQAADRRYEQEPFFNAPGYLCNITVLRHAVRALEHWLDDLDGSYFEDDQYDLGRRQLYSEDVEGGETEALSEWDAVVLYSELSEVKSCVVRFVFFEDMRQAQLCQLDEAEERKERSRRLAEQRLRSHVWCPFAPAELDAAATKAVALLEVVKPGTSSKGSGVVCLLAKDYVLGLQDQYVEKPLLLFSGRKFDLRQWVLVRSFQPLEVYMFSSCYLRLCNEPYDLGDLANRQRHISNWSVNKHGKHVATGAVASLSELNDVLEMMTGSRHYWENDLVPKLKECILHSLRSVQDRVVQRSSCFEVYGFDFLLGEDLKPWPLAESILAKAQNCKYGKPPSEYLQPAPPHTFAGMATRLLELVLNGLLQAMQVCIADETPEPGVGQPDERPLDLLTVVGKALNLRAERRFGEAWRQSAAQVTIARFVRGFLVRHQGEIIARQNAAKILQRRVRACILNGAFKLCSQFGEADGEPLSRLGL